MNLENFKRVLDHIEAYPETWCQNDWHCNTKHCIAGHAQIMAGKRPNPATAYDDAKEFFDIDVDEADWLFFRVGVLLRDFTELYSFHEKNPNKSPSVWADKING